MEKSALITAITALQWPQTLHLDRPRDTPDAATPAVAGSQPPTARRRFQARFCPRRTGADASGGHSRGRSR